MEESMEVVSEVVSEVVNGGFTVSELQPVVSSLGSQINVPTVIGVVAGVLGASVAVYLAWWGIRLALSALGNALNGRLGISSKRKG